MQEVETRKKRKKFLLKAFFFFFNNGAMEVANFWFLPQCQYKIEEN